MIEASRVWIEQAASARHLRLGAMPRRKNGGHATGCKRGVFGLRLTVSLHLSVTGTLCPVVDIIVAGMGSVESTGALPSKNRAGGAIPMPSSPQDGLVEFIFVRDEGGLLQCRWYAGAVRVDSDPKLCFLGT